MIFDELHQKYGSHIAKRVQLELSFSEFTKVAINELLSYLEMRAEEAHKAYQNILDNPFAFEDKSAKYRGQVNDLYQRWKEAEDLSYLIMIADDVSANTKLAMASAV